MRKIKKIPDRYAWKEEGCKKHLISLLSEFMQEEYLKKASYRFYSMSYYPGDIPKIYAGIHVYGQYFSAQVGEYDNADNDDYVYISESSRYILNRNQGRLGLLADFYRRAPFFAKKPSLKLYVFKKRRPNIDSKKIVPLGGTRTHNTGLGLTLPVGATRGRPGTPRPRTLYHVF